jgi:hypothetical protein
MKGTDVSVKKKLNRTNYQTKKKYVYEEKFLLKEDKPVSMESRIG